MNDDRRFLELAELYLDDALTPEEAGELHRLLASDATQVQRLSGLLRDQVLCRTALRPADAQVVGERTRRMLAAWHPDSGEVVAHAVFTQVDRRRRWRVVRGALSLAAAALVLLLVAPALLDWVRQPVAHADADAPVVTLVEGDVRLGTAAMVQTGLRLGVGGALHLSDTATATLGWSDGTSAMLGGGAVVERLPGSGQRLRLDRGELRVQAAPRPVDLPFEITAPDVVVRVVGTTFAVRVENGVSHLAVDEGLVRLTRRADGVSSLLGAGQIAMATRLPLPSPVQLSVDHLAAVRTAIAAGREPWASAYAALRRERDTWLAAPVPPPTELMVPEYDGGNPVHSAARRFLHSNLRPLNGLALLARLDGDADAERAARARLIAATTITVTGADAGTLACDMQTIFGLPAADLLRALPTWTVTDQERIDAWIVRELQPRAEEWSRIRWMSGRWRGLAALATIAAWRGDHAAVLAHAASLRTSLAEQFDESTITRLGADPVRDQTLYQALSHALFCADVARVAAGDITPPPPAWTMAVETFLAGLQRNDGEAAQQRLFLRALTGPAPWRSPTAATPDQTPRGFHTYGWYFPELMAHDPRW